MCGTWGDLATDVNDKKFGFEGVKDGKGGLVSDGEEWAVSKSRRGEPGLRLEHGDEAVSIEIV